MIAAVAFGFTALALALLAVDMPEGAIFFGFLALAAIWAIRPRRLRVRADRRYTTVVVWPARYLL